MLEATIIGVSIFAVMMASQFGNRDYTWHKVVMPLVSIGAFGYFYLKDAPTSAAAVVLYAVGAAIGLGFGVVATLTTKVTRNQAGEVRTITGKGFVMTWLVALAVRLAFIWAVTNVQPFLNTVGEFMYSTGIVEDAIAPFFVLMALVMVASRVALIGYQVSRLPRVAGTVSQLATV